MGVECAYPARKPKSFTLLQDPVSALEISPFVLDRANTFPRRSFIEDIDHSTSAAFSLDLNLLPSVSLLHQPRSVWFLMPEAWKIEHGGPIECLDSSAVYNIDIKSLVVVIQGWLESWTKTGCNPFIHPQLYRMRFPGCLQVAYTTLTSYLNRTASNTEIILRIVNEQAGVLLVDKDSKDKSNDVIDAGQFDTLEKLARVHALLVYQSIGLFDGDIRSRHLAEERIPILDRLADEMIETASRINLPSYTHDSSISSDISLSYPFKDNTERIWHAWIIAESVRRTWRISKLLQSMFCIMQRGWFFCPGGIYLTTRRGFWDASTASEWEKLCSEVDAGFKRRFDTPDIFLLNSQDVDEFGTFMLESTYGSERLNQWRLATVMV